MPSTAELFGQWGMNLISVSSAPGSKRSRLIPDENVPSIGVSWVLTDSKFTVQGYLSFHSVHMFRFDVKLMARPDFTLLNY